MKSYETTHLDSIINVIKFNPDNICFAVGAATTNNNVIQKIRFLGTAVLFDRNSKTILTCAHLVDKLEENESLCLIDKKSNYLLKDIKRHSAMDLIMATIENGDEINSLINFSDVIREKPIEEFHMGLKIRVFGYTSISPNAEKPELSIEIRQGYVPIST